MPLTDPQLAYLKKSKKTIFFNKESENLGALLKYIGGDNLYYNSYNFYNQDGDNIQMYLDNDGVVNIDGQVNILQSAYSDDLDVISNNKNTSFVDYNNLQNTFYTHIGGEGNDLNPQMSIDKDGNVYMAGVYKSPELNIYDCTNNNIPVGIINLDGTQSLFITKYSHSGVNEWRTRIGGVNSIKSNPTVFANANGEIFVSLESYENLSNDINIYDVNNVQSPVKTLPSYSSQKLNVILVKYNTLGEYQWNLRVVPKGNDTFEQTSNAIVTGDLEGNIYLAGFYLGGSFDVYDTTSDLEPATTFTNEESIENSSYFIIKFNKTGKLLWVNHLVGSFITLENNIDNIDVDYTKMVKIGINTDSNGNLYLTSTFNPICYIIPTINIYNKNNSNITATISIPSTDYNRSVFNIKYDKDGNYKWHNMILAKIKKNEEEELIGEGTLQSSNCIDADGNLYITFSNNLINSFDVFDTRKQTQQPVYSFNNSNENYVFVSFMKFSTNGIFQWNNFIKTNAETEAEAEVNVNEYVNYPVIACDNRYIHGKYKPNIYLQMNSSINNNLGGFNFYNANSLDNISYTLQTKGYWTGDPFIHSMIAKYDTNGQFVWATTSGINKNSDQNINSSNIQVDKDGHVYIAGSYYEDTMYIWDVSRNGPNDNSVAELQNIGGYDCYLIKYNRFGFINQNTHRDIYIEDSKDISNSFEKSIIITNNVNQGPVNCKILEPSSSGFGYNVRRTITLVDSLDLICNNGKWIPKVQAEQISLSKDLDVIDINSKLSVIDYSNLSELSWTTKIGGTGDEQNIDLSSDKDSNVYVVGSYSSNSVSIIDYTDSSTLLDNYNPDSSYKDIFITKYLKDGAVAWATHISLDADLNNNTPTIYTDAFGNSFVSIVKFDNDTTNNFYIFDIRDNSDYIKTLTVNASGTVIVKYDKDGIYQWHVKVNSFNDNDNGTKNSAVVCDDNGNLYACGYISDSTGVKIYDSSEALVKTIDTGIGMFLVKFDKTGKYLWSLVIDGNVFYGNGSKSSIACDTEGNLVITGIQNGVITINQIIDNVNVFYKNLDLLKGTASAFMVKYDTNGKCLWTNVLCTSVSQNVLNPTTTIDGNGNLYLACQVDGTEVNIYDTRNSTTEKATFSVSGTSNTVLVKYNGNGIIQWYTYVSSVSKLPSISVDNRFIKGISKNNVYLSGAYNGATTSIYNAVISGAPSSLITLPNALNNNCFLIRYDNNGLIDFYTRVGGADADINNRVVATQDGHAYLGGEFKTATVKIYQGSSLNDPNLETAITLDNSNAGTYDLFLVKYNRYGLVNNGGFRNGRELYIENSSDLPDGTEKTIVIINNGNFNEFEDNYRKNVCLLILDNLLASYDIFRTFWMSEGITLISYDGKWFVKSSSSSDSLPKRSIVMWGGSTSEIPGGWRLCDGGSLNGVTTPDLRGRFVLSYGQGPLDFANTTIGALGGEQNHTLTINEMPSHNHSNTVNDPGHRHQLTTYDAGSANGDIGRNTSTLGDSYPYTNSATTGITVSIDNTGGSLPHNNLPPYYVLAYIMKCY